MVLLVLMIFAQVSPVVLDGDILSSNTVVINEFMAHPLSSCTETSASHCQQVDVWEP